MKIFAGGAFHARNPNVAAAAGSSVPAAAEGCSPPAAARITTAIAATMASLPSMKFTTLSTRQQQRISRARRAVNCIVERRQ